ncbi:MAG: DsrE family protein [Bacteroidales bacterium]|nr:DsrE family protein [Bacteroidales bacterium]
MPEDQTMTQTEVADVAVRDGVFIHITESYNDPHRVLMPLKMATIMANDKDVLIYMDIHAVELAVKGAKDLNYADFESFQTYVKKLAEMKVGIYACPTCLKIAGFKPEDLMDGIQVAQKDKFFSFTKGRIITLDY